MAIFPPSYPYEGTVRFGGLDTLITTGYRSMPPSGTLFTQIIDLFICNYCKSFYKRQTIIDELRTKCVNCGAVLDGAEKLLKGLQNV